MLLLQVLFALVSAYVKLTGLVFPSGYLFLGGRGRCVFKNGTQNLQAKLKKISTRMLSRM